MDAIAAPADAGAVLPVDAPDAAAPTASAKAPKIRAWIPDLRAALDAHATMDAPAKAALAGEIKRRFITDRRAFLKKRKEENIDGKRMMVDMAAPVSVDGPMKEEVDRLRRAITADAERHGALADMREAILLLTGEDIEDASTQQDAATKTSFTTSDYNSALEVLLTAGSGARHAHAAEDICDAFSVMQHACFLALEASEKALREDDDVTIEKLDRMKGRVARLKHTLNLTRNLKAGHENHRGRWTEEERALLEQKLRDEGTQMTFPSRTDDAVKYEIMKLLHGKYAGNAEVIAQAFPNLSADAIESLVLPTHKRKRLVW